MDPLFFGTVFGIALACGVFIMAVACIKPEHADAPDAVDVNESHPLEAPAH